MRVTSPRRLRAHRAAQRWAEQGDLFGVAIDVLQDACADAADLVQRDLDLDEVNKTCSGAVRAALDDCEQEAAERARRSAAEDERLRYLERVRRDVLLQRDDDPKDKAR